MKVELTRKNKAHSYEAETEANVTVNIGGSTESQEESKFIRPMESILIGLGGCASIDLGMILKKQKQDLVDYKVEVNGTRTEDVSKSFESIHLHFHLWGSLEKSKVERAIDLTLTKYCSVALSLNKEIKITNTYTIY